MNNTKEYGKTLIVAHSRLDVYLFDYQVIFKNMATRFPEKTEKYTRGVLVSHRSNIEQTCDNLVESDYYQMQHFITNSDWIYHGAIDIAAR